MRADSIAEDLEGDAAGAFAGTARSISPIASGAFVNAASVSCSVATERIGIVTGVGAAAGAALIAAGRGTGLGASLEAAALGERLIGGANKGEGWRAF